MNNSVNENWFEHGAFITFKLPTVEKYVLMTNSGTLQTLEGEVKYNNGDYLMTGPKGEKYPISPEKFKSLKDDQGNGICTPKKILKKAKLADHDGFVTTKRGPLNYTANNDYIIRHNDNDYGVVKKDIFEITYDLSERI